MDVFEALFRIVTDILERYPIITPIATLLGIVCIVISAVFKNSEIGIIALAILAGINLAIVYQFYEDITFEEFTIFLFFFIIVITFGILLLPKLKLDSRIEPIVVASLGLLVAPILISINVVNQIRRLKGNK
jgi:hypothetical protein